MWIEKNGPTWRIRDLAAGKKVTVQAGYTTKTAANRALTILKADQLRGCGLVPRGGDRTLDTWIDTWLPAYEVSLKPSSRSELARIRNHVRPLLGGVRLADVDAMAVQDWVATLLKGRPDEGRKKLSVKTVRNCHGILHKIMAAAVRARLIPANPCADTDLPARVHREMRFLTDPEIGRLILAMPAHWRPLVLLLVATGLRWGEAIGLRAKNCDVLARKLVVLEQLQELSGTGEMVFVSPKSERSRRTVTFTLKVSDALAGLVAGKERDDVVFRAPMGGLVRTRNFRRTWTAACKRAGLEGLRIHDLRHTHAGMLISAGSNLAAIQRRLGHSSIAVTVDLYGHLREEVDESILAAVAAALAEIDLDAMGGEVDQELTSV